MMQRVLVAFGSGHASFALDPAGAVAQLRSAVCCSAKVSHQVSELEGACLTTT